jgi:hypothetical protein
MALDGGVFFIGVFIVAQLARSIVERVRVARTDSFFMKMNLVGLDIVSDNLF